MIAAFRVVPASQMAIRQITAWHNSSTFHAAAYACSLISQNFESISNREPKTSWATDSRWPPMLLPFLSAYHQFLPLKFGFTSTTYLNLAGSSHLKVALRRMASNLTERNAPESLRVIPI